MIQSYGYASEKFAAARRALMPPHPRGEAASIASAFLEISVGLEDLDPKKIPAPARNWIMTLRELMDTTGISDPKGRGKFAVKAEQLTDEEKSDRSTCVDELSWWFERAYDEEG
jgi:hypothetical protein